MCGGWVGEQTGLDDLVYEPVKDLGQDIIDEGERLAERVGDITGIDQAIETIGDYTVSPDIPNLQQALPNYESPAQAQAAAAAAATAEANAANRSRRQRARRNSLDTGASNVSSLSSQPSTTSLG